MKTLAIILTSLVAVVAVAAYLVLIGPKMGLASATNSAVSTHARYAVNGEQLRSLRGSEGKRFRRTSGRIELEGVSRSGFLELEQVARKTPVVQKRRSHCGR